MTVRTSYMRPEDDPTSWFNHTGQEGIEGPTVVTAISEGHWSLERGGVRRDFASDTLKLGKLFVPPGWRLTGHKDALLSGYVVRITLD